MKHAAVLYTCIGLMGAAAVTGFVDYTHASKAGLLKNLYSDEKATLVSTLISNKEIDLEDYSRGPLEEEMQVQDQQVQFVFNPGPKKPKKVKKIVPPPPPPIPDTPNPPPAPGEFKDIAPPTPQAPEAPVIDEVPVTPPAPATEVTLETPVVPPTPEIEVKKEISFKSFSRAPLSYKKSISKRKKN